MSPDHQAAYRAEVEREYQEGCAANRAASAEALSRVAGPVSSLGLATCSLPVSGAGFFAAWLEARAIALYNSKDTQDVNALCRAAAEFRRQMGLSTPRQPEENNGHEPTATPAVRSPKNA